MGDQNTSDRKREYANEDKTKKPSEEKNKRAESAERNAGEPKDVTLEGGEDIT